MTTEIQHKPQRTWRKTLFEIIFESDTPAGKWFDLALIVVILLSVLTVMLDSVSSIRARHGTLLQTLEWGFTIVFTIEYILRLLCVSRPIRYAVSFFGVVDLLAILPTYLSLLIHGSRYLAVVRVLRVLRIFRVLKLGHHTKEARVLKQALYASHRKILVFLSTVLTLVVIIGALMYVIEGPSDGFTSIPRSVYWAIVTLTTVGYGDISPETGPGQFLAALVMLLGYSIIAVPTGIVTVEWSQASRRQQSNTQVCPSCSAEGHDNDAVHCKFCGAKL
ncbi:MAG: ion transporter [Phycisphaerales bacterium]|nr:MAG: ion transporter [Phycisphaerales bacterium]